MQTLKLPLQWLLLALGVLFLPPMVHAETVSCHYSYGGETKIHEAHATTNPYDIGSIQIGSYFQFRVVFEEKPSSIAAIKVYTYADRDDGPVLIHQATYPYPPHAAFGSQYGFSGYQTVYEPVRDGELQYWCEMTGSQSFAGKVMK